MRPVLFLTTATLALAATPLHAQDLERPTDWLVRVDRPTAHDEMLARSLSGQSSSAAASPQRCSRFSSVSMSSR